MCSKQFGELRTGSGHRDASTGAETSSAKPNPIGSSFCMTKPAGVATEAATDRVDGNEIADGGITGSKGCSSGTIG